MDVWQKTKKLADENRVLAGALGGAAAGSVVPVVGTLAGALGGALVGFLSYKDKESKTLPPLDDKPKK